MRAIRVIAALIRSAPSSERQVFDTSYFQPTDITLPDPPTEITLDRTPAESINGGSLIFPGPARAFEPDWCVLALYSVGRAQQWSIFRFSGRLRSDVSSEEFVQKAYEYILMRKVDNAGRKTYSDLIDSGRMTKREVLKTLAGSLEAQTRGICVLVIPQPSPWLPEPSVGRESDAWFPPLTVKANG